MLGNHDNHRIATRVGLPQARVAAMLLLTLRGTPTLYYGDELGMCDVPIPPERVQDPFEQRVPGIGLGRDPERTPMQWSAAANAGFSEATPWLPVAADFAAVNVEAERDDPTSMLALHRALIDLRRSEPALGVGDYATVACEDPVLAYVRRHEGREFLIALNFAPEPARLQLPPGSGSYQPLLSTLPGAGLPPQGGVLELRGDEGVILQAT